MERKENLPTRASGKPDAETISSRSYDMEGHAKKCVERCCQLANKRLTNYTQSRHHTWMTINFKKSQCENCLQLCSQIVVKCLYLARLGRPDIIYGL